MPLLVRGLRSGIRIVRGLSSTALFAAVLTGALLGGAPSASALPGPGYLATGFDSDTLVFDGDQVDAWFPRMEQFDATWVRIPASWRMIAPANRPPSFVAANPGDSHYNWSYLDRAVRDAAASNEHVLLMLDSAPSWALGPNPPSSAWPGTWRPSPTAYGAFVRAVALRYSGHFPDPSQPGQSLPLVSHFQAWNEPNLPVTLAPQWSRVGHSWVPASPTIYRGLLNAAYASIKSVQPKAYVLAAGLGPYGDPPGVARMRPVLFLRELLCLHGASLHPERCDAPAHLDAIDMHPYAFTPTIHAFNADDVSVPDLGRLSRVLQAALRTGRALPRGQKSIWVTEVDWSSSPPDSLGIPLAQQARYVALAFYQTWLQGVSHTFWYELLDPGGPAGSFTGAGLFFARGLAKPATVAFRFPFVALDDGNGVLTLWGRAPTAGVVTVEVARGGTWGPLTQLRTTRGGVFFARQRIGSHLTLRARLGAIASYPWSS
ncbi:MAG: hypothetical protein JO206_08600 [Solirubrobacterales bacterium]|nr:hypothetical protein [Solirubrobacterales bacterium]MBV9473015.1 hypothetical protein [Solirubrobacterales bacterium]